MDLNFTLGVLSLVVLPGPDVMVVFGALVSTVTVRTPGVGSTNPPSEIACTARVCLPSLNGPKVRGLVQAAHAPPSAEQRKVVVRRAEPNVSSVVCVGHRVRPEARVALGAP